MQAGISPHEIAIQGDDPLIYVHMSKDEQKFFDELIGGPHFLEDGGEESGIRDYSDLAPIFAMPEVRDVFIRGKQIEEGHVYSEQNERLAIIRDMLMKAKPKPRDYTKDPFVEEPAQDNNLVQSVARMGEGKDKEIAVLPASVALFFDSLIGEVDRNPETGFRQYGKFWKTIKKIGRWALPVIGAIAGGGVGGALGGALGGAGAKRNVGQAMLTGGLMGGAGGIGVHGFGAPMGMFGQAAPFQGVLGSTVQGIGSRIGGMFGMGGAPAETGMGSLFGSGAGEAPSLLPSWMGGGSQAASGTTNIATGGGAAGVDAAKKDSGGFLSSIGGLKGLGTAMSLGSIPLMIMGHQKEQKERKKLEREAKEAQRRQMLQLNDTSRKYGLNDSLDDVLAETHETPMQFNDDYYRNVHRGSSIPFAKGGHVQHENPVRNIGHIQETIYLDGHEKGQDDNLYGSVPDGAYIVHATNVSDLGDGNSLAGANEIDKFVKRVRHAFPHFAHGGRAKGRLPVDAALSAGEVALQPEIVEALGGGSNKKGAKILDLTFAALRRHKSGHGEKLPPKALSLVQYLPKLPSVRPKKIRRH